MVVGEMDFSEIRVNECIFIIGKFRLVWGELIYLRLIYLIVGLLKIGIFKKC